MSIKKKVLLLGILAVISIIFVLFFDMNFEIFHYAIKKRGIKASGIIITAISIGSSTVLFQTITNNRIITPSIFGLDSLYLLIQALVIFLISPTSQLVTNANLNFVLNFSILVIFGIGLFKIMFARFDGLFQLLLSGIIFSTLFQSIVSVIQMLMDPASFDFYQSFMFASFNNLNENLLWILILIVLSIFIFIFSRHQKLDVLALGKDSAINLGLHYQKEVLLNLTLVLILTAVSTALVGPITFLGFLIVNLGLTFLNTYKHQYLLPAVILFGIFILSFGHILTEQLFGVGVPISIVINLIGGIYFITLLIQENLT